MKSVILLVYRKLKSLFEKQRR